MNIKLLIVLLVLAPIAIYLKGQVYSNMYGNSTIGRDTDKLLDKFKEWNYRRKLRRKYKHLNKRKQ